MRSYGRWAALALVLAAKSAPAQSDAPSLRLSVASESLYTGVPFELSVVAEGFEESPTPDAPVLAIPKCDVQYLGVSPSVQSMIQIVNGRRSEFRRVSFVYRYRVVAEAAGRHTISALTVRQGTRVARSPATQFRTEAPRRTGDMRIERVLPRRPIWVGETVPVQVDWYLRRNVADQSFVLPLLQLPDRVRVAPAPLEGRKTLVFSAGARDLELPYEQSTVSLGGASYERFRFFFFATPLAAGTIDLPPPRVSAELESGRERGVFGFARTRRRLFQAVGKADRLRVRPLPQAGRPARFTGTIARSFSLRVEAEPTVVAVGDPVKLRLDVRSDGSLEGLRLPPLVGPGALSPILFEVVGQDASPSVIADGGGGRRFEVSVRVKSPAARQIPGITWPYFDPKEGTYRSATSAPIAISVRAGRRVSAADVVRSGGDEAPVDTSVGAPSSASAAIRGAHDGRSGDGLLGADLTLSAPDRTLRPATQISSRSGVIAAVYALSIAMFLAALGFRWTAPGRSQRQGQRRAARALQRAIKDARSMPASDGAAALGRAVRAMPSGVDAEAEAFLVELDQLAFDPDRRAVPVPGALCDRIERWASSRGPRRGSVSGLALGGVLGWLAVGGAAQAAEGGPPSVAKARAEYTRALAEKPSAERKAMFRRAASAFAGAARAHPGRPELLADWGAAALAAGAQGEAALAFRRALHLDPNLVRAQRNLAWIEDRQVGWQELSVRHSVWETFFFWHRRLNRDTKHAVAMVAFFGLALGASLGAMRRRRWGAVLVVPGALFWVAMVGSLWAEDASVRRATVVEDGLVLRAADNASAPPARAEPVPAGLAVQIVERRGAWTAVAVGDGAVSGWLPARAVIPLEPEAETAGEG